MVDIENAEILRGDLPTAKKRAVLAFIGASGAGLMRAWHALQAGRLPERFE